MKKVKVNKKIKARSAKDKYQKKPANLQIESRAFYARNKISHYIHYEQSQQKTS